MITIFFSKTNLESLFRYVTSDKRKNLLESILYECRCRSVEPEFGCVGTVLRLKKRCDYLEMVIQNLLAHNPEVASSTLSSAQSHPLVHYQSEHQVPQLPEIEDTPIEFPFLLQDYLQTQFNHNNFNFGLDGGNNVIPGFDGSNPGFNGGDDNNNSTNEGSVPG